jgi:hypothetical protein
MYERILEIPAQKHTLLCAICRDVGTIVREWMLSSGRVCRYMSECMYLCQQLALAAPIFNVCLLACLIRICRCAQSMYCVYLCTYGSMDAWMYVN